MGLAPKSKPHGKPTGWKLQTAVKQRLQTAINNIADYACQAWPAACFNA
jgi:hypothetical protein